jgi:methyl-accepting chemotaxis protein
MDTNNRPQTKERIRKYRNIFSKTLQRQILIPFLTLLIVSSGILTFVSYTNTVSIVTNELTNAVEEQMVGMNESFELFFQNTGNTINRYAEKQEIKKIETNKSYIMKSFEESATADETITNIYLGTSDGEMILYPPVELPSDYDPRTRPWYEDAINQKGEIIWTEPYIDTATNEAIVSAAKAVFDGSKLVGVMSIDISINTLIDMINRVKIGESGYAVLIDNQGKYLAHPFKENVGKDISKESYFQEMERLGNKGYLEFKQDGQKKIMAFINSPTTGWKIAGTVNTQELAKKAQGILFPLMLALGAIIVLAVLISIFVSRKITKPIKKLQETMKEVELGNLSVQLPVSKHDEIGKLSESFNGMIAQMQSMMKKVSILSNQVSEASQTLVASAEENTAASNEVATTMEQIASGASSQTEIFDKNTTVMESLAEKIRQVEKEADEIYSNSESMHHTSQDGLKKVHVLKEQFEMTSQITKEMVIAVQSLDQNSTSINNIVSKIAEIASQTNLLALNAAIEAARAGEAGKGFAVVADEVRKLAEQTESSLKDISSIIGSMQIETKKTVNLIGKTHESISEQGKAVVETEEVFTSITTAITSGRSLVENIAKSMDDMVNQRDLLVKNVQEVTAISQETAAGTQQVSASIEETTASMEQLNHLALELDGFAREMNEEIIKFKLDK